MAKAEISWKRVSDEGVRLQVYVQHVGRDWRFFARERRYDQCKTSPNTSGGLLKLLDAFGAGSTAACSGPKRRRA